MAKTKKAVAIIIYALLIVLAAITVTDVGGFLRTLPFIFILPPVATLLYNKRLLTVLLTFVAVFFVSSATFGSVTEALMLSVVSAIFSFVGIYVKRLIVTCVVCDGKAKKIFCIILSAVIAVISFGAYFCFFGDPVSAFSARNENIKYIGENYAENDINIGKTTYSFSEKRYFTKVTFTDDALMNADISVKNNVIIDGYNNYYEYKYMSNRAEQLALILSESFREDFGIGCNTVESDILFAPNVKYEDTFDKMVFDVYFGTQTADEAAFAKKCASYAEKVKESGFSHMALKFYGGFAGDFYYEMTVESDFSGDLTSKVLPFNENHLVKRETEADYMDHWSYGR